MKVPYTHEELVEIQQQFEQDMHGSGINRFDDNNKRHIKAGNASDTAWNRKLIKSFVEPMAEAIDAYLEYYNGRRGKPSRSLVYLRMLPPTVSSYVTIKVVFDCLTQQGLSLQMVAERIGKRIEDQVRFTKLESTAPKYVKAIKEGLKQAKSQKYEHGHNVMIHGETSLLKQQEVRAAHLHGATYEELQKLYGFDIPKLKQILAFSGTGPEHVRWQEWSKVEAVQLGARLIDIFCANVLHEGKPIVTKEVRDLGRGCNKSVAFLAPTAGIVQWVEKFKDVVSQLSPCFAPCVIPPRDWKTPNNGGFHSTEVASRMPLVKVNDWSTLKRLSIKQMPLEYKAVNALQRTGWTVNEKVLDAAMQVLQRDLSLGIPCKEPIVIRPAPVPEQFLDLKKQELKEALTEEQWEGFTAWMREAAATYDLERERRSKYLEVTRTIKQAEKYREFERIYFVYSMDFRSRKYAQSSLIGPQGSDLQKGLVTLAKGKALGAEGRYWLAVAGSSVWGNDKCSLDEMAAFTEAMSEDIMDYAADPLAFRGWSGADKPWQFLNFCFEWAELKKHEDAGLSCETFVSHTACAQDGSCSGIQHYSAMLRDPVGGAAVNLVPSQQRRDIYADVAGVTTQHLINIASGNEVIEGVDEVLQKALSEAWLSVGIKRGMTKKPVMTLPYGSSQLTCRESIGEYLTDIQVKEGKQAKAEGRTAIKVHPFSNDKNEGLHRFEAEKMGSRVVWGSIGEVVVAPRAGMKYLKAVCAQVSKHNLPLEWQTPTGFIVHQALYEMKSHQIDTQLMGRTTLTLCEETELIDRTHMKSACSPNFVHSMDGAHLTLAVCGFEDAGIEDIACIHDSFGTYAADTGKLRKVLLDSFVDMYQQNDVLQQFATYNEERMCEAMSVEVPSSLGLDLEQVRHSTYAFAP